MLWAIPIGLLVISFSYGILFYIIAWISEKITSLLTPHSSLLTFILKATGLLVLSYIHPFGFDWFKPELMFVNSYLGIEKWQFEIILLAIVLYIWKKQAFYFFLVMLAFETPVNSLHKIPNNIKLVNMHISVEDKWNEDLQEKHFEEIFEIIDTAIDNNKTLVILPESVFPIFLNYNKNLFFKLKNRARNISIVVGGLYWDGKTPHNSAYIFTNNKVTIANKVLLVPFGESNPLPDFLSDWVNRVFYDNAVDYKASKNVVDYSIDNTIYRNAICFEATSEKLYEGKPKNMIVLSNNGWFTPSTEPTLQRLLLQYYSKKYNTTIYHSVNMSKSYVIQNGKVVNK
jgi:apolipoprotein N-acyltransferase